MRQLGAMLKLNPLLLSMNGMIISEAALAIDNLKKSSTIYDSVTVGRLTEVITGYNSLQDFGFGFHSDTGIFDLIIRIKQDHYDNSGVVKHCLSIIIR